jgi:hypothetical protein
VSDILAQQDGAQSPGTRFSRRSVSFARSSFKTDGSPLSHYIPNRSHIINSARQRKVSAVSEESQSEDGTVQEQRPTAVTSKSNTKSHDSDEEVQGSNLEPCPEDSPFEVTGVQILSAPSGQNLGLSEHIADTPATDLHADSGTATYDETWA